MAKSRGRKFAELISPTNGVFAAGSLPTIPASKLPTIQISKLENSTFSVNSESASLGGNVIIDSNDVTEHTNALYFTNARADARITAAALLPLAGGTMTGNLTLDDNVNAYFGASTDLRIYHDGTNSHIINSTGELRITGSNIAIKSDSNKLYLGAADDLKIYHDGSNSYIEDAGTGSLILKGGTISVNGAYTLPTSDGSANQVLQTDGSGTLSFATVSGGGGGTAGIVSSANATAMTINSDEEIGIGLTNPGDYNANARNLVVGGAGSNGMTLVMGQNNGDKAGIHFRSNSAPSGSFSNITSSIEVTSPHSSAPYDEMIFTVSSEEFMRFGKGNSSVGTYMLFGKTNFSITADGVQTKKDYEWTWTCPSSAYPLSVHDGSSGYKFEVRGSGQISSAFTSISSISDERVKENIVDLETGLTQIMALQPRRFDFKDGEGSGEKNVAGFVAQEVEAVLPELIDFSRHDTIADLKSLKMGDMIPTMVKAMQEQQAVIESLTNRIAALEQ